MSKIKPITKEKMGEAVGISTIMVFRTFKIFREKEIEIPKTLNQWILAYCKYIRERTRNRPHENKEDLNREKAKLARAQAEMYDIRIAKAQNLLIKSGMLMNILYGGYVVICKNLDQHSKKVSLLTKDNPEIRDSILDSIVTLREQAAKDLLSLKEVVYEEIHHEDDINAILKQIMKKITLLQTKQLKVSMANDCNNLICGEITMLDYMLNNILVFHRIKSGEIDAKREEY